MALSPSVFWTFLSHGSAGVGEIGTQSLVRRVDCRDPLFWPLRGMEATGRGWPKQLEEGEEGSGGGPGQGRGEENGRILLGGGGKRRRKGRRALYKKTREFLSPSLTPE